MSIVKNGVVASLLTSLGILLGKGADDKDLMTGIQVMQGHLSSQSSPVVDHFTAGGKQVFAQAVRYSDGAVAYGSIMDDGQVGLFLYEGGSLLDEPVPVVTGERIEYIHFPEKNGPPACIVYHDDAWHAVYGTWEIRTIFTDRNQEPYLSYFLFYQVDGVCHMAVPTRFNHQDNVQVTVYRHGVKETEPEVYDIENRALIRLLRLRGRNIVITAVYSGSSYQSLTVLKKDLFQIRIQNMGSIENVGVDDDGNIYYQIKKPDIDRGRQVEFAREGGQGAIGWNEAPRWLFGDMGVSFTTTCIERQWSLQMTGFIVPTPEESRSPTWSLSLRDLRLHNGEVRGFKFGPWVLLVCYYPRFMDSEDTSPAWIVDPRTGAFKVLNLGLGGQLIKEHLVEETLFALRVDNEIGQGEVIVCPIPDSLEAADYRYFRKAPLYGQLLGYNEVRDGRLMGTCRVGNRTIYRMLI